MVESCLGNYVSNFEQEQVYYVGFSTDYELYQTIQDIYNIILKNRSLVEDKLLTSHKPTPDRIYFSCSKEYINQLPEDPIIFLSDLSSRFPRTLTIEYNILPNKFLDNLLSLQKNCIVTCYGHNSEDSSVGELQLNINCAKEEALAAEGSLIKVLNGTTINDKLKDSHNLFIFIFFACYARNFKNGLTSNTREITRN